MWEAGGITRRPVWEGANGSRRFPGTSPVSLGLASSVWPSPGRGPLLPRTPQDAPAKDSLGHPPADPPAGASPSYCLGKVGIGASTRHAREGVLWDGTWGALWRRRRPGEGGARPLCSKTCWGHDAPQRPGRFSTSRGSASKAKAPVWRPDVGLPAARVRGCLWRSAQAPSGHPPAPCRPPLPNPPPQTPLSSGPSRPSKPGSPPPS